MATKMSSQDPDPDPYLLSPPGSGSEIKIYCSETLVYRILSAAFLCIVQYHLIKM
jgi:hypothetical protein